MQQGRRVYIPGLKNWLLAQLPRFAPRRLVGRLSSCGDWPGERTHVATVGPFPPSPFRLPRSPFLNSFLNNRPLHFRYNVSLAGIPRPPCLPSSACQDS